MMNIFVGKLSWGTTNESLRSTFEEFGPVTFAKVITDRESGRSRGFGFVEMENEEDGLRAIEQLDNSTLDGRTIAVKQAEPREEREPRAPRSPRY
jgi:RNA recognition motif-containing protein